MKVYLLKKQRGRVYKSENCLRALAEEEGFECPELSHDEKGAPLLGEDLHISISDTKSFWACALSKEGRIGLDIEEARNVKKSLPRVFHALERQYLAGLEEGSSERTEEVLNIWTRKESYMKFSGEGMRIGLSGFSVIAEDLSIAESAKAEKHERGFLEGFKAGSLTGALCGEKPFGEIEIIRFEYGGEMKAPAKAKAEELLAGRDFSEAELAGRLYALGYSKEEAEKAAAEMRELGYVNDARYAENLAKKAAEAGKSEMRIKKELLQRGVSKGAADEALAVFSEECGLSERERAKRAVSGLPSSSEKDLARIGRKLSGLGYSAYIIYGVLDELKADAEVL